MAGRIAGITIEIGGDTTNLQKSLKGVDSQLRKTQSTLKDVDKLLKLDPGNTELLTQKQKNLEKAIGTTKTRLNELKNAQEGVAEGSEEWDALQREIIATQQDLQGLEQELRSFGSVGAQQIAAVGSKMQEVGGKIEGVGQKLSPLSSAAAGLIGSLVGLGYSAVTGADDLNTLAKQTGLSTAEIQKMQYASDLVDVSFDSIAGALRKMKSKMDPANESFKTLGISVTDADGNLRDASDVFYEAIEALSKIENETERDQMAMELFGKSADDLAGIIDDGGAALKEYGKEAEDLGLILDQDTLDSLNEVNDTVDKLKANFKGAFAKLGATVAQKFAPAFEKLATVAQKVADKIANLSPETVGLITKIAGVVAAIAPMLIVGGKLVSGIGKVLTFAPMIKTAITGVTAALASPIGVIALVAAAAVALGVVIYKNWDKIKAWTLGLVENIKAGWEGLKTAAAEKWEAIKASVVEKVEGIKTAVIEKWETLKADVAAKAEEIKAAAVEKWEGLKESVSQVVTNIKTDVYLKWTALKSLISSTVENIKASVVEKWEAMKSTVADVANNIHDTAVEKWEALKESVSAAAEALKTSVTQAWGRLKSAVTTAVNTTKANVTNAWNNAKSTVVSTVQGLQDAIQNKWNAIKSSTVSIVSGIVSTIGSKFRSAWSTVTSIFGNIQSSISSKINAAKDAVSRAIEAIKGFFNFTFSWPHIPLPHFSITPEGWKVGDLLRGTIPSLGITWYRKAYDNPMLFKQPTVLQTPQGLKGFGDGHGAEIVLGLNKLRELVGSSGNQVTINVYPPAGANVEQIAAAVEQKLVAAQQRRIRVYA